jgi:enoyl-CoA hydratase/carnithine racemase
MTTGMNTGITTGITYASEGAVARILIDRPDERNMLLPDALAALKDMAAALERDREVQVVVITGAGRDDFSAGLLNPDLKLAIGKEGVLELVALANATFDAVEALPQIVIAAINGDIRAGAVELALACDIRIAADHVTLAMPEAKWGGFPGAGAPVRLPGVVGHGRAIELIATGREIDAGEMERYGLVERLVPFDQLTEAVDELVGQLTANGPLALRGAKRIARLRHEPGFAAARELSDALRHAFEWTADADEGVAAHRENRTPRFTGR